MQRGRWLAAGVGVAATMTAVAAVGANEAASRYGWAAGLAGCDVSRPAVAHHANQQLLTAQPDNGPVPCGTLTGWPAVENRIEVSNTGAVIYEPALQGGPLLAGGGHAPGWGREESVARTFDQGARWDAISVQVWPDTYLLDGQVDNNLYVDHDTGRLFFYMYNSLGGPQIPGACGGGGGATVAFSDNSGTTWAWGFDHDHDCAENPTILTGKPTVAGEQRSFPNVVYLCGDSTSSGVATTGTAGYSCSKSLNGGVQWRGTTLAGQGFYSGVAKDLLDPYPQCAGASSSAGANVQPFPDGTLLVVVSCNGHSYLSESKDEGATWKIATRVPHGGELRVDSAGNLYLLEQATTRSGTGELLLSHSTDDGHTWSPELNMVAPGVTTVGTYNFAQGTYAPGQVGHVAVTYYGTRRGNTTSDGFITETRDALDTNPVFWSGQVNSPRRPLLYNTPAANIGITVLDFNGGALSPDGRSVWGSWVQDCGTNMLTDPNCQRRWPQINPADPQDGFAGRLIWPPQ